MKRRSILTGALAAGAAAALSPYAQADILKRGIKVPAGKDRFDETSSLGVSRAINWKVSGRDTNGGWCSFEALWEKKGGPPLHVHYQQEEWFYVIEGDYVFRIGEEKFRLAAGDSVLAPRQVPHAFAHVRDGYGKIITVFQPAGEIEAFFREYGKLGDVSTETAQRLFRKYDMEILGPPLDVAEMLRFSLS
jgi:mannose-6-phosphate isomerase-like protein (cupin superfamily)